MVVTAIMAIVVIWRVWQWPLVGALALMLPFVFIDFTFLSANLLKIFEGGWMPSGARRDRDGGDVYVATRQPAVVREDSTSRDAT